MNQAVKVQPVMKFQERRLGRRLRNWGLWLNYQSEIGPVPVRCISIESRHVAEIGDVCEEQTITHDLVPDVTDAEAMEAAIRTLGSMERYCLAVRYAGYPAVMRLRRVGDHSMRKMADNAETTLVEYFKSKA